MPRKKSKKPKVVYVACENVKVDQVIKIKEVELKVTEIVKLKAKRGGFKYRLVGLEVSTGKKVKEVKPADRKFVLVKGDAKDMVIEEAKEEETESKKEKTAADFDMTKGSAGAAMTVPIRGGEVRKGSHVMLKGHPCKVVEVSISKTGKHGHAKANITGIDVFTGKKYVEICPTSHNMTSPVMFRDEWMLTDIQMPGGQMTLMNQAGQTKEDLDLPKDTSGNFTELANDIIQRMKDTPDGKAVYCIVLKAMTTEQVVDVLTKEIA